MFNNKAKSFIMACIDKSEWYSAQYIGKRNAKKGLYKIHYFRYSKQEYIISSAK